MDVIPVSTASCCQLPASRPAPDVHARKRAGRGKNPFLFAMLFEKNIEIFSDPNPSVLCVFSICPPRFRAWSGGTGNAGGYNAPGLPEIEGHFDGCDILGDSISDWRGAFIRDGLLYGNIVGSPSGMGIELPTTFSAMASNPIYGSSATVMPASINLPVILYLGILA